MSVTVSKSCVVCTRDVSGEKRRKDAQGRYYCIACSEQLQSRGAAHLASSASLSAPPFEDREIDLAPQPERPKPRPVPPRIPMVDGVARIPLGGGLTCPCCQTELGAAAKICIDCGIRVPSGKPMITALGRDENLLYGNAETIIRALSWLLWFGLYPITSEAYAIKKPIAIWVIAIITTLTSIGFFIALRTEGDHPAAMRLMLWPANHVDTLDAARAFYRKHAHDEIGSELREMGHDVDSAPNASEEDRAATAYLLILATHPRGEFHWYQLLTHTLLHDPNSIFALIMHLGGNMLFLLIFGTRVNALIGNLKMAILYPLLGAAAGGAHLLFHGTSGAPSLGASGAIMGLAGMYLIFFPVHRVYMAFWLKIMWRIPTWIKIWPMRGFWVLGFYLSFDIASTLLRANDGVAHWAHLGGFFAGALVALALLTSHLQGANHGDLLSVLLGKHSWPLIGKHARPVYAGVVRLP